MFEIVFGIIGIFGTIATIIALVLYLRERTKVDPKIIQTFQRVTDPGDFLIQALVSNLGSQVANSCSAKIYVEDNPIEDLSFAPIDSPVGRIGQDWPKATVFKLHPKTPIMLRGYLNAKHEATIVRVRLFSNGNEVDKSPVFTLTKP